MNLRSTSNYQTRSANKNNFKKFSCRTGSFKHSFFPFCVRECNKLDNTIRDAESIKQITSMLMNTFLNQISLFSIHDPKSVNCLQDCSLCCVQSLLLHRNEHKFHHNFKDCGSPMCDCGAAREITCHFLLRCQFFSNERQ